MSIKKKLEEGLYRLEDNLEGMEAKSGEFEKRFLEKHGDSIDRFQDKRDQAAEGFGKLMARIEKWFDRVKEVFEERSARSALKKNSRR